MVPVVEALGAEEAVLSRPVGVVFALAAVPESRAVLGVSAAGHRKGYSGLATETEDQVPVEVELDGDEEEKRWDRVLYVHGDKAQDQAEEDGDERADEMGRALQPPHPLLRHLMGVGWSGIGRCFLFSFSLESDFFLFDYSGDNVANGQKRII